MPTSKPRINVTLEQHEFDLFKRYAELQGVSMSKVISGFMGLTIKPVERLCVMLESINNANTDVKNGFKTSIDNSEQILSSVYQKHISQNDLFLSTIDPHYEPNSPLAVTTGDRYPLTTHETGLKGFK